MTRMPYADNATRCGIVSHRGWLLGALGPCLALAACGGDGTGPAAEAVAVVEVTGAGNALAIGQTMQLSAVARDSLNATIAGASITWTTSSASVASVSTSGLVRGVSAGTATVTASSGGKSAIWDFAVRDTAPLPRSLRGRIERVNLTLAGTYTVTEDLVLIADSALRIDGTLILSPGASLTLWADELVELSGSIEENAQAPAAVSLTSRRQVSFSQHESGSVVIGGKTVNVRNHLIDAGCPIAIAARRGVPANLVIANATIIAADGRDGIKSEPRGNDGCHIQIGTQDAQTIVQENTGKSAGSFTFLGFRNSQVLAGDGGAGYTLEYADGRAEGNRWEGTAADGGKGGNLEILSTNLEVLSLVLQPGEGGPGGGLFVTLRNGSGPNGEGESLTGITGNGGSAGDIIVSATNVMAAHGFQEPYLSPPGPVSIRGGNGTRGAQGGDMRVRVGDPGPRSKISVPSAITVEPTKGFSDPPGAAFFTDAANGGHAITESQVGGRGGEVIVEGLQPGSASVLFFMKLTNSSNGGAGFDGCAVRPKKNGTDGGPAGIVRRHQTPMELQDSFFGGPGGHGKENAGKGGTEGRDVDSGNLPIGARGSDGEKCPDYLGLGPIPPSFQHVSAQSPCPQTVASTTITNTSMVAVTYSATVNGTVSLILTNANGTLQPGESRTLTLLFICATTTSFNATLEFVATPVGGGTPQTTTIPITGLIYNEAVELNHTLAPQYPAGSVIELIRISTRLVIGEHLPFCAYKHLHANSLEGIRITEANQVVNGPYPDPDRGGCGYGKIILVLSPPPAASFRRQ